MSWPRRASINRLPAELRLSIARQLVRAPDRIGDTVGLRDLSSLARASRTWSALLSPVLSTEGILSDLMAYGAPGGDHLRCLQLELDGTNELTLPSSDGILMSAALEGDLELLRRLTDHVPLLGLGLDAGVTRTALLTTEFVTSWRCRHGNHLGLDSCSLTAGNLPRATLLHAAVLSGQEDVVSWLLDQNVPIDQPAFLDCVCYAPHIRYPVWASEWDLRAKLICATAVHMALAGDVADSTARLLIRRGAVWDRPFPFSHGTTALHLMTFVGAVDLIEWLADDVEALPARRNGPFHDWPDDSGRSCFHYACHVETPMTPHSVVSRLIRALFSLGALYRTSDVWEVNRRLDIEIRRFKSVGDLGPRSDSDREWALRLADGGNSIKGQWHSRVCPATYAEARLAFKALAAMEYMAGSFSRVQKLVV